MFLKCFLVAFRCEYDAVFRYFIDTTACVIIPSRNEKQNYKPSVCDDFDVIPFESILMKDHPHVHGRNGEMTNLRIVGNGFAVLIGASA